ncbi:hypothetical protein EON64_14505 [archaeon]|nr:MAG: hypothetical protein EON64_14505 [archaeon]
MLEIEYRKATAGTKVTCRICGKKFYPDKLRVHRKYFCGETAQRTEAQARTQKKSARVTGAAGGNDSEDSDGESSGGESDSSEEGGGGRGGKGGKSKKSAMGGSKKKSA